MPARRVARGERRFCLRFRDEGRVSGLGRGEPAAHLAADRQSSSRSGRMSGSAGRCGAERLFRCLRMDRRRLPAGQRAGTAPSSRPGYSSPTPFPGLRSDALVCWTLLFSEEWNIVSLSQGQTTSQLKSRHLGEPGSPPTTHQEPRVEIQLVTDRGRFKRPEAKSPGRAPGGPTQRKKAGMAARPFLPDRMERTRAAR